MWEELVLKPRGEDVPPEADFSIVITDSAMEPLIPRGSRVYVSSRAALKELDTGLFLYEGRVRCRRWCDYNGALILLGGDESRREDSIYLDREQRRRCLCLGKVLL